VNRKPTGRSPYRALEPTSAARAVASALRFNLAGRTRRESVAAPRARAVPVKPAPIPATGVNREKIVNEVAAVDDLELRELIARVRITNDK
jgi:hypothetical protein